MIEETHICAHCGAPATHQLKNGKWCCHTSANKCPAVRHKNHETAFKHVDKTCPHCHQTFHGINSKVFANHVRWCPENPDKDRLTGPGFKQRQLQGINASLDRELGPVIPHEVTCARCGKVFAVHERERQFPSKEKYFCCKTCANTHEHSEKSKRKISEVRKKYALEHVEFVTKTCLHCGNEFQIKSNSPHKFCCCSCASQHRELMLYNGKLAKCRDEVERQRLMLKKYRQQCAFTFALNAFPDEFDFDLIRKYGWYKAKNHGDNQNGVNRDHMYSVKDGFINHVDPKIISHPANCKLMLHSENCKKNDKSSITLEQLLQRISNWTEKYGDV